MSVKGEGYLTSSHSYSQEHTHRELAWWGRHGLVTETASALKSGKGGV